MQALGVEDDLLIRLYMLALGDAVDIGVINNGAALAAKADLDYVAEALESDIAAVIENIPQNSDLSIRRK